MLSKTQKENGLELAKKLEALANGEIPAGYAGNLQGEMINYLLGVMMISVGKAMAAQQKRLAGRAL